VHEWGPLSSPGINRKFHADVIQAIVEEPRRTLWVLHLETAEPSQLLLMSTLAPPDHISQEPAFTATSEKGEPATKCRLYKARTTLVVQRATSTVAKLHSLNIPKPSFSSKTCSSLYKEVKAFLGTEVSDLPEIQMAFQSIKKLLPPSCPCMEGSMLSDLKDRLTRPPPVLSPQYIAFCRNIVAGLFPSGWDRGWESKTETFSPSLSSCIDSSRSSGGQLSKLAADGQDTWRRGLKTLTHVELVGELLLVDSAGKPRPLTRFSVDSTVLSPLHDLIYDHLSKQPWLLRGEVSTTKLFEAGFRRERGSLVSGDYVSASDNLPIEIAELILDVLWSSSRTVPASVFSFAVAAQRPVLNFEDQDHLRDSFVPTIGQMMGSYLCFPLLCIQNYLAFRWAAEVAGLDSTPPVLINGDDILFQHKDDGFYNVWVETIVGVGFEVEHTKTSCSASFGTINSTLLRWREGNLVPIRTYKMGMLRRSEHPSNLGASFDTFCKVGDKRRWFIAGLEFLQYHSYILGWNCVAQDMGFRGRLARSVWRNAWGGALWLRESVLRSASDLPALEPLPCPHSIVMKSEEFQSFPADLISPEMSRGIGRWMAARKWQLGKTFVRVKSKSVLEFRRKSIPFPVLKNASLTKSLCKWAKSLDWRRDACDIASYQFALWHLPDGSVHKIGKTSWWLKPARREGVRVPVPLLAEFGLLPHVASVEEILSRKESSLFGVGAVMLYNSHFRQNVYSGILAE